MNVQKHRLHPFSILLFFINIIKKGYRELISFSVFYSFSIGKYISEWFLLIPVAGFLVYGFFWWLKFTFSASEQELVIEKGVFSKNKTHIPVQQIQVIQRNSSFLQQLFSLETLEIETAGAQENATLRGIPVTLANELVLLLKVNTPKKELAESSPLEKPNTPRITRHVASWKQLLIMALSSKSLGVILAFVIYGLELLDDFVDKETLRSNRDQFLASATELSIIVTVSFTLLLILFISIVYTFIRYYQFTLEMDNSAFTVKYGLFEKKQTQVPFKKVQSLFITKNPVLSLFGRYRIFAEVSGAQGDSGGGRVLLFPILTQEKATEWITGFYKHKPLPNPDFKSPASAWFIHFFELMIIPALLFTVGYLFFDISLWWITVIFPFAIIAWFRFTRNSIGLSDSIVCFQSVFFAISRRYIPIESIQDVSVHQSYLQQKANRSDLELSVKVGSTNIPSEINHLDKNDCHYLKKKLCDEIVTP